MGPWFQVDFSCQKCSNDPKLPRNQDIPCGVESLAVVVVHVVPYVPVLYLRKVRGNLVDAIFADFLSLQVKKGFV